jgi:tRNA dimethylallyltransferase
MTQRAPRLLVIVGPTASGKSTLAARLGALVGGEVVSADSVQVYRHFDIGAGKPSGAERALCPHHLIDVLEPTEEMEASAWAKNAAHIIADIAQRGGVPIVCGGTYLWVRALLFGLAEAPAGDESIRARHRDLEATRGREHLHQLLAQVDEVSAARLHPNDFVRVSRALEVFELSGRPLSALQQEHGFKKAHYAARLLTVDWARPDYEARVRTRITAMLDAGLIEEVKGLLARGLGEARAMGSVGYRQVAQALRAGIQDDRAALLEAIVRATRIFARRQRTWLRDQPVLPVSPAALIDDEVLMSEARRLGLLDA